MFSARPTSKSTIYTLIMQPKCTIHSLLFTQALMNNFIEQKPQPAQQGGSLIFGLASGLWSVLTLGYGNRKTSEDLIKEALLARESLLILLVLSNNCTKDSANPYREALFTCTDSTSELNNSSPSSVLVAGEAGDQHPPVQNIKSGFKIDFPRLYSTLCTTLNDDQTTLLMYMLLHQNGSFKMFVLSRTTDLDQFVVPLLKILYNSTERNSHHIYMSLIILLVLSEDNLFNNIIHEIVSGLDCF